MPDGHLIHRRQVSPEHVALGRSGARALGRSGARALGRAVRELRVRRGMSQEELGYRGDLHRNYVGALERGEINPTFRVLLKVEHGLSVPLTELTVCYERQLAEWW